MMGNEVLRLIYSHELFQATLSGITVIMSNILKLNCPSLIFDRISFSCTSWLFVCSAHMNVLLLYVKLSGWFFEIIRNSDPCEQVIYVWVTGHFDSSQITRFLEVTSQVKSELRSRWSFEVRGMTRSLAFDFYMMQYHTHLRIPEIQFKPAPIVNE